MWQQTLHAPDVAPLLEWQGLRILPGLNAVTGDEGSGKTRLLQTLAQGVDDAMWLDLRLPEHDPHTPSEVWQAVRKRAPNWNEALCEGLVQAFDLQAHLGKRLFMLSTGSRRKVALVALLAGGARITCIDQPCASLDMASVNVLCEFLQDMSQHTSRAWLVADYTADPGLDWRSVVSLAAP